MLYKKVVLPVYPSLTMSTARYELTYNIAKPDNNPIFFLSAWSVQSGVIGNLCLEMKDAQTSWNFLIKANVTLKKMIM